MTNSNSSGSQCRIAVDAMGGDFAPEEIIKGSVQGAREYDVGIIFVGPEDIIKAELAKNNISGLDIEIEHTDEYLVEGEHPAEEKESFDNGRYKTGQRR